LADLSPQQKAAVQYINGPLLILAGAGSGKTSLLIYKIAWLIREYAIEPGHIVALGRTPAGARALRARLAEVIGSSRASGVRGTTFNELSWSILRERVNALALSPEFSLYDRLDGEAVIGRLLRERLPNAAGLAGAVQRQIALWKRRRTEPSAGVEPASDSAADVAAWLYRRYQERLTRANAVDLDDLTLKAGRLLASEPAFAAAWGTRVRFLLVDEYEQVTPCEHELVRRLTAGGTLLTAAGDPDQAIDDGSGESLQRLKSDIPRLRIVKLEQNFRSTGRLLKAANALLGPAAAPTDKAPWSQREFGAPLRVIRARSEEHEAERVVAALLDHKSLHGLDYRNYAVLFRRLEHAGAIEHALRARRIPYRLCGGPSFYDQTEVRDLLGYLRLLVNPRDDNAFLRAVNTPRRSISRAALDQLARYAGYSNQSLFDAVCDRMLDQAYDRESLAVLRGFVELLSDLRRAAEREEPAALVHDLLARLRYEQWLRDTCNDLKLAERRMENVTQLVAQLTRRAQQQPRARLVPLAIELLHGAALGTDSDDTAADGVVLSTLAAAKGHEFAHVYWIGLEEGILPLAGELDQAAARAERRLLRLALTRARDSMTFTIAERRRQAAETPARQPSRFLAQLAADDIEWLHGAVPENNPNAGGGNLPGPHPPQRPRG
jgi:ATP-dependent DNA helicase Rep